MLLDYIESFRTKRWSWMGIAMLQPIIIAGIYFPNLPIKTMLFDWVARILFLGIVVWTRHALLNSFRYRPFRRAALCICPLLAIVAMMGTWRTGAGEIVVALRILDALINGYLIAMMMEPLIAALGWAVGLKGVKTEEKPFKIAERMRFLRRSVDVIKRVIWVVTLLVLLGLYVLNRSYVFDWVLYSRLAAGFIGIGFVIAMIVLYEKVKRMEEKEMQWVEREIETAIDSLLAWRPPGQEQFDPTVFSFWYNYRQLLIISQRTPLNWEVWAFILLLQGLILVEPFIMGIWAL